MRTLVSSTIVFAVLVCGNVARAQLAPPSHQQWLAGDMEQAIKGCATPIMQILTKNYRAFRLTNDPDYKTNDVPYEFTVKASELPGLKLEGVMLCPVSGHVPLGGAASVNRANADKYARGNVSEIKHDGKVVASGVHNGAYVLPVPFAIQLHQGKNQVVMFQRNPKTGESAHVGGFPMGRQFNITVTPNSALRRAWSARGAMPWQRALPRP